MMDSLITEDEFWRSISILTKNFHAICRKISGVKILEVYKVTDGSFNRNTFRAETCVENITSALESNGVVTGKCSDDEFYEALELKDRNQWILLSRNFFKKNLVPSHTLQVIDLQKCCFYNIPLSETNPDPRFNFMVQFCSGHVDVTANSSLKDDPKLMNWFSYVLRPRLLKWAKSDDDGKGKVKSLGLVDIEEYTQLYSELKSKYGKEMVERWTETTDPLKYVYEDVAIASYLILIWRKEPNLPRNFLDMGCGNGLLVHILNSEGYSGHGVDIRKRKIWDIYPETTNLKEHTIIPNDYTPYSDVDWIIGNHSDELSPWIPVIAARSSFETKFFLLPCCAYEFSGRKFQRRDCSKSVYNDFLNYVTEISRKCGFRTDIDRLKIPSTKRVAIVGSMRSYGKEDYDRICIEIDNFVETEISNTSQTELKIRNKVEPVRNCTKIDRNIIDTIVMKLFRYILSDDDAIRESKEKWNRGRAVTLQQLAQHLSKEDLKSIKSECGGLKTLIKNKHDIFEVLGDQVRLRYPKRKDERPKSFQYKRRSCFFFQQHPDSCPLNSTDCSFVHERIKE